MNRINLFIISLIVFVLCFSGLGFGCPGNMVISVSSNPVNVGQTVTFTAICDSTIQAYEWIFPAAAYCIKGQGARVVSCKFSPYGTYTVQVRYKYNGQWYGPATLLTPLVVNSVVGPWYVSTAGNDDYIGHGDWQYAFRNIQTAIDSAASGDEICVYEGTYYEQLDFKGKSLNVHSYKPKTGGGWELAPETTIIDANKQETAIFFRGSEYGISQLKGFTIREGFPSGDGLALDMKFDAASDSDIGLDSSVKGRNGIITGSLSRVPDHKEVANRAVQFSGDDYIQIDGYKGISGNHPRTCAAWIKTNNTAQSMILAWGTAQTGQQWMMYLTGSGKLRLGLCGGYVEVASSNVVVNNNIWHHVAAVLPGNGYNNLLDIKLYVDGIQQATVSGNYTGTPPDVNTQLSGNVCVGAKYPNSPLTDPFIGSLDDIQVYSRALDMSEIRELANYSGPVAHWKMDEISGNSVMDSSTGNNTGTIYNSMNQPVQTPTSVWTTGRVQNSLQLNNNEFVKIVGYNGILGGASRTCSAWVKTSTTDSQMILTWGTGQSGQTYCGDWSICLSDGKVSVGGLNTALLGTRIISDGRWHHIAVILDNDGNPTVGEIQLYIDGVLDTVTFVNPNYAINTSNTQNVLIGSWYQDGTYSHFFNGKIDDVCIYDRALSQDEIFHMAGDIGVAGYWKLDGNADDSSASRVNGVSNGSPGYSIGMQNQAMSFDGTDDYVQMSGYKGITGGYSRTCAAWINTTKAPGEIISWGPDTTGNKWIVRVNENGTLRAEVNGGNIYGTTVLTDGKWHHIVVTLFDDGNPDISEAKLYVDGRLEPIGAYVAHSVNTGNSQDVRIGVHYSLLRYFKGFIDDVRIYERAITGSEIQTLYQERFADGGGIQGHGAGTQIVQCVIEDNKSNGNGGGINQINGQISNCLILRNESPSCGGAVADSWADIINCTVVKNKAVLGGGLYACSGLIENNIIWDNTPDQLAESDWLDYNCINGWTDDEGTNIACNPSFMDPSADNYTLKGISSCIDAGDPSFDYSNEPGNNGGRINMGMFGNTTNAEIADHLTDTDGDGLKDYQEIVLGTNPAVRDSDNDGLEDGDEIAHGTNPLDKDSDNDGMSDGWEIVHGLAPKNPLDAQLDSDGDGLTNVEEYRAGTDPGNPNSDSDGMSDGWEVANHLDPTQDDGSGDLDNDGVTNAAEFAAGTHPFQRNTESMITEYEYDNQGRIQKQIIHDGQATAITYATTEYVYDETGRQWKQRQYKKFGAANNVQEDQITLKAYDVQGNVKMTVRKAENSTNPNSPENGDLVTVNKEYYDFVNVPYWKIQQTIQGTYSSTAADKVEGPKVTEYRYWLLSGQLYQVKAPKHGVNESDRAVTTYEYDNAGKTRKVTEATSHYRQMQYDSLGQLIKETAFKSDGTPVKQTRTEFDDLSRVQRQAIMASAAAPDSQAIQTNLDSVTDYYYDYLATPIIRDYPGRLIAKTIYYTDSGTPATTYYSYNELEQEYTIIDPDLNSTMNVSIDSMGRVCWVTEASRNQVTGQYMVSDTWYDFDFSGRLYRTITEKPDLQDENTWRKTTYKYDAADRKRQEIKPNGVITEMQYNGWGSLTKQIADAATGGKQQTTVYDYDRFGRQKTITGYTGTGMTGTAQTTTYSYNDLDKVTQILYPDTKTMAYTYFDNGMVQTRTDQRSLVTTYAYDLTGRNLSTKTVTQDFVTTVESFSYDTLSRMQTANKIEGTSPISASVFAYFDSGKLQSEQQTLFGGAARTVSYLYDPAGYRKKTIYPQGTQLNRTNDWQGRTNVLTIGLNLIADYDYVGSHVARRTFGILNSKVYTDYSYDNLGRLGEIYSYHTYQGNTTSLLDFKYHYAAMEDNIEQQDFKHRSGDPSPANIYAYDGLDRLNDVEYLSNSSDTEDFSNLDNLGNRTGTVGQRDADHTYTVNSLTNRYTAIDSQTQNVFYDDAGNLTIDKDGYHYSYDYENRPVRIYKLSGQTEVTVARFAYDAPGRRIMKEDSQNSANTRYYYYNDNWQILCEYNLPTSAGTYKQYNVWGSYIDEILYSYCPGTTYTSRRYLHDHLYNPAAILYLTSSTCTVIERCEYDAFGTPHYFNADFSQSYTVSQQGNTIGFTGREIDNFDFNAGIPQLTKMHYRHREYSAFMGQFYQEDPLQYIDGLNLYEYVISNPVSQKDPFGTLTIDTAKCWQNCSKKFGIHFRRLGECRDNCVFEYKSNASVLPDFGSIVLSMIPDTLSVQWQVKEVKIPTLETPWGKIGGKITDLTCSLTKCQRKDNTYGTMANVKLSAEGTVTWGPSVDFTEFKKGMPKLIPSKIAISSKCPACENRLKGEIYFQVTEKAGAILSFGGKQKIKLWPWPKDAKFTDQFSGEVVIEIGAYAGAEVTTALGGSVEGTYIVR